MRDRSYGRHRARVSGKLFELDGKPFRIQGVTYGPFASNGEGAPFPTRQRVLDDIARMKAAGINTIRTYHVPPGWFLDQADEQDMAVFVDVPWVKHLCFLSSTRMEAAARQAIQRAAEIGRDHTSLLAYSIANEIPPDIIRWHGSRRIERFLSEAADVARQTDSEGLVTYGNYPPTEYLELGFLDFITFNVYLHERETFRRYLFRLQNLVGDKPLLLGEIGMDTIRHGELEQASFLAGHSQEAMMMGLAGVIAFAWTDDWHTGGYQINNWAFGITNADRSPKASFHALREQFQNGLNLPPDSPRVSVIVCTYNGGQTLEECLRSLLVLNYPNYEVIVVDDGSTDNTSEILTRFEQGAAPLPASHPPIRVIRQPNQGLSAARNSGFWAADGAVIAYTDSDCFAPADWLTHLVYQLQRSEAAGVGGPNLTPEEGWLPACVAAAPGQPVHVLESDQTAEHIPGCNMAFRREALAAINGFDPIYRKAGDDVDVCWRLQQAGFWITFAPGAFVWHHRRSTPRRYLRQQAGYGEAEALLRFKHPDKFNYRGAGKWRGVLYGAITSPLRWGAPIIYRGTFGTGMFQCLYQPGAAHWALVPSSLEWHLGIVAVALAALFWPPAWFVVAVMLVLSLVIAGLQASQAPLARPHKRLSSRILIAALCYAQPLVRSWTRYHTRLLSNHQPIADPTLTVGPEHHFPVGRIYTACYWCEAGGERSELLRRVADYLTQRRWGKTIDAGWSDWDMEIYCHPWTVVRVQTVQEEHGSGKRLLRVRFQLRPSGYTNAIGFTALLVEFLGLGIPGWITIGGALALVVCYAGLFWKGKRRAAQIIAVFDAKARELYLIRCHLEQDPTKAKLPICEETDQSSGLPIRPMAANDNPAV